MINKPSIILSQLLIIGLVLIAPVLTLAQDANFITCTGPQGITQVSGGTACDFGQLVTNKTSLLNTVIDYTVKYILTPLATIAILYAGIKLALPGRPEVRTEMKNLLFSVVLGMVLVFASYLIVQAIVQGLASTKPGSPGINALNIFKK